MTRSLDPFKVKLIILLYSMTRNRKDIESEGPVNWFLCLIYSMQLSNIFKTRSGWVIKTPYILPPVTTSSYQLPM